MTRPDALEMGRRSIAKHEAKMAAERQAEIDAAIASATAELRAERLLLAKLAADTPQFYNPMEAMAAKVLRDRVLSEAALQPASPAGSE